MRKEDMCAVRTAIRPADPPKSYQKIYPRGIFKDRRDVGRGRIFSDPPYVFHSSTSGSLTVLVTFLYVFVKSYLII